MASRLVLSALFALAVSLSLAEAASHHHGSAAAPAPGAAVDCSSLVLNMADCLSYVSNGSTTTKPEGTCCSGLKTVLKTDAECLCEAFKSSAQLGVVLNVSKALTLPAACKLNAPSASNCGLSLAAPAAPAGAPVSSSSGIAGAPTANTGVNQLAPAPTPGASGSRSLAISFGLLVIGLVLASVPGF